MAEKEPRFKLGDFVGWGSALVTFLTTNWTLLVTAVLAMWASSLKAVFDFANNPHVNLAIQLFVLAFWTYVGIRFLVSLRDTSRVFVAQDFRYGISPDGYSLGLDHKSDENAFQLGVHFRNHVNSAVKIKVEQFRILIDDRTCPEGDHIELILPRIAVRGIRSASFKKDVIKENMNGIVELKLIYGDPDGEYIRRFHMKVKVFIHLNKDKYGKFDNTGGVADEIISITDSSI